MKVTIKYTVTVTDDERFAINHHFGLDGKATHETVRDFFKNDFDLDAAMKKWYAGQAEKYAKLASEDASE